MILRIWFSVILKNIMSAFSTSILLILISFKINLVYVKNYGILFWKHCSSMCFMRFIVNLIKRIRTKIKKHEKNQDSSCSVNPNSIFLCFSQIDFIYYLNFQILLSLFRLNQKFGKPQKIFKMQLTLIN